MARPLLIDEFHLTVSAPAGLPEAAYAAIRRALDRRRLHAELRAAARAVLRRHAALRRVRVTISR